MFREIQWPDDDPMRLVVSADGTLERKAPTPFTRMADGIRVVKNWIDGAMYFPPRQVRPPRTRLLPATVHRLEVIFDETGALRRFEYVPRGGFTKVATTR